MNNVLNIDADSLFYDAFSTPEAVQRTGYGFRAATPVGHSHVPTEITDEILERGLKRVERRIAELRDKFFGADVRAAVKGDGNFRYDVHAGYKGSRAGSRTLLNDLANETIKLAIDAGWAIPAHGMEADDLVRMWSWQDEQDKRPHVTVHMDKDLNCIVGTHYNYRTNAIYEVDEASALFHYHYQLIVGDSTDSIPGARLIGDTKARVFLANRKTREEYQEAVVEAYIKAHPDDWPEKLDFNGKLIHMLRFEGDFFDVQQWPIVQALS